MCPNASCVSFISACINERNWGNKMPKKTARTKAAATKKAPARRAPAAAKPKTSAQELQRLINQMVVEQQHHIDSIAGSTRPSRSSASPRVVRRAVASGSEARPKDADTAANKGCEDPRQKKSRQKGGKGCGPEAPKAARLPKPRGSPRPRRLPRPRGSKAARPQEAKARAAKGEAEQSSDHGDQLILDFLSLPGGASTEDIPQALGVERSSWQAENNLKPTW